MPEATSIPTTMLAMVAAGGMAVGAVACYYCLTIQTPATTVDLPTKKRNKTNVPATPPAPVSSSPAQPVSCTKKTPVPLNYVSVGVIDSCFPTCRGTPRQGYLMPSAKANLILHNDISEHTLQGLSDYTHVWILFHFHKNRQPKDKVKTAKQRAGVAQRKRPRFKAKIQPPKLKDGTKVGVFAARTPHRPNAIGLTLVKLISVNIKTKVLELSGIDLVHGTPVVDIKPYVPHYDAIPTAGVPTWVATSLSAPLLQVEMTQQAKDDIRRSCCNGSGRGDSSSSNGSSANISDRKGKGRGKRKKVGSELYEDAKDIERAVIEMLRLDMNSGATANKVQLQQQQQQQHEHEHEHTGKNIDRNTGPRIFYATFHHIKFECHWFEKEQRIIVKAGEHV